MVVIESFIIQLFYLMLITITSLSIKYEPKKTIFQSFQILIFFILFIYINNQKN